MALLWAESSLPKSISLVSSISLSASLASGLDVQGMVRLVPHRLSKPIKLSIYNIEVTSPVASWF